MWTITFNSDLAPWSQFVFWYVAINAVLCALFTLVVAVGGAFDLRFLWRALREGDVDEADDGRVVERGPASPERTDKYRQGDARE